MNVDVCVATCSALCFFLVSRLRFAFFFSFAFVLYSMLTFHWMKDALFTCEQEQEWIASSVLSTRPRARMRHELFNKNAWVPPSRISLSHHCRLSFVAHTRQQTFETWWILLLCDVRNSDVSSGNRERVSHHPTANSKKTHVAHASYCRLRGKGHKMVLTS